MANTDTWEWNRTSWVKQSPANKPPDRYDHAMAYDSARGKLISWFIAPINEDVQLPEPSPGFFTFIHYMYRQFVAGTS